mmetsp:Transcript_40918/g.105830  ORF Transcript_40918/g.105830 Transcript_40918/m.105830 type:complete len:399 (+) Transcript_40918:2245-3441(+)
MHKGAQVALELLLALLHVQVDVLAHSGLDGVQRGLLIGVALVHDGRVDGQQAVKLAHPVLQLLLHRLRQPQRVEREEDAADESRAEQQRPQRCAVRHHGAHLPAHRLEHLQRGAAELALRVVQLAGQLGAHERVAKALEDGVGGLEHAADDGEVAALLLQLGRQLRQQRLPLGGEVVLADDGERLAQLALHPRRGAHHQGGDQPLDMLLLVVRDGRHVRAAKELWVRVHPSPLDVVLKVDRRCLPDLLLRLHRNHLEHADAKVGLQRDALQELLRGFDLLRVRRQRLRERVPQAANIGVLHGLAAGAPECLYRVTVSVSGLVNRPSLGLFYYHSGDLDARGRRGTASAGWLRGRTLTAASGTGSELTWVQTRDVKFRSQVGLVAGLLQRGWGRAGSGR